MTRTLHQIAVLTAKDLRIEARGRQTIGLVMVLGVLIIIVLGMGLGAGEPISGFGANPVAARFVEVRNNGAGSRQLAIGEMEVFAPGVTPQNSTGAASSQDPLNNPTDLALNSSGAHVESVFGVRGHGADDDAALTNGTENTGANTFQINSGIAIATKCQR